MALAVPSSMATMARPTAVEANGLAHALLTTERPSPVRDRIATWCAICRADFDEMPGMRLTVENARRLWSVDADTCRRVLDRLVERDFLIRAADGCYGRADRLDGIASSD
jgi:hypothetical protein